MKKKLIIAALCGAFALLGLFAGCTPAETLTVREGVPDSFEGKITLAIDDTATAACDYYVQASAAEFAADATALDVIDYFVGQGLVAYEGSEGEYGMYMTAIGVVEEGETRMILREDGAAGKYLSFYTNVETDMQGSAGIAYGSTTVEPALVGVSSMAVQGGAVIYVTYFTYA